MAPGGPTVAGGARRGGKFNKPTRGGGKHYSRSLQPVDAEGNQISMWSAGSKNRPGDEEEDSSEEESSEEEGSDDAGTSKAVADANREDRKALKKARKDAAIAKQKTRTVEVGDLPSSDEEDSDEDEDMPANPNHSKAARTMAQSGGADEDVEEITDGVKNIKAPASRREREAVEAAAAKERYMRLQAQGKTDEAKADLARLKLIREQRAAESARRQAEKEEKEEQEKARRAEIEAKEAKKREAAAGPKKGSKKK
ncbi:hypothetical protein TOPH_02108 [Tolypocladium ophioglossoides CBS 100239]|uniref:Casein kinase substrate phosphoprotein PP28 domain-containing protein n=1 Tax=Tolypocladium ophioglossoides (strain CBS 100239) TaxID=1163406 RepID=A0A0L0NH33_TOLOC|nr:hypothetical protein TOPH_02108 [Tolypocladium ophioglossoides CBS 100239]